MDERQELNAGRAALFALTTVMLVALGVLAWEYITTKDVTNMAAVVVMLGSGALFLLFQRMFGAEAPRSILGRELPTGSDDVSTRARRRSYLMDALLTATGLTVLSVGGLTFGDSDALGSLPLGISGVPGLILLGVLGFLVLAAITFGIDFWAGESQSKAVERRMKRLGGDE